MLVAASTRCFSDLPLTQAYFHLDDLGYDKIELWLDEERGPLRPSELVKDPDRFCARYREMTRLTPISFCLDTDLSGAQFRVLTRIAKQLRIPQISVASAKLGTPFNSEVDRLKELTQIGIEDGIVVSFKCQIGHLSEDPRTAVEVCQAVPGLGITYDPSVYLSGPQKGAAHDQIYGHVYHVHLRDTSREQFQVPVGLGLVDYARIINQLERTRFSRTLSVELHPELMDIATRGIEMRKIRLLIESLL
ncbi:MAG: sugar phosphate isomerase/epimerase family protein [Planctomycetaceae bacterium]|jgi:sugar phosphate isomerase/epimerase